jgi:hypothetical protein
MDSQKAAVLSAMFHPLTLLCLQMVDLWLSKERRKNYLIVGINLLEKLK